MAKKTYKYVPQKVSASGTTFVPEKYDDNAPVARIYCKNPFVLQELGKKPSDEVTLLTSLSVTFEIAESAG